MISRKNTREILIKSATNLFYQKGYTNASVREIGAMSNISDSIIYYHFENKEDILFEIIYNASNDLLKTLLEIDKNISDPLECLTEMLKAHTLMFSIKRRKELKIAITEAYLLHNKNKEITKNIQIEIYKIYKGKLEELKRKQLVSKDIDSTVLTFSILGIVNSFYNWFKEGRRMSKETIAENILNFIIRGFSK